MSKKAFEELLNKHETVKNEPNWEQKKQAWLNFIQQFYDKVEQWLKPYVEQRKLSYDYYDMSLTEEYIGTYTVKAMNINFAEQQVRIEPVGTLLIGTKGRIDMEGARGKVQFILANKECEGISMSVTVGEKKENQARQKSDLTWKIVLKEARRIAYDDFNEENFFSALMEIING